MKEEKWKCCLCHNWFKGWGNNAQPLKDGICCDVCNATKVIPARISMLASWDNNALHNNNNAV